MNEEAKYAEIMQRLDDLNKIDIDERFTNIEKHMRHFITVCTEIKNVFHSGINIKIDETAMSVINPLKETLDVLKKQTREFIEIKKSLETDSVLGTLKYMAKQLNELTKEISTIKEEGLKKSIHLALTMDGYEMVKKRSRKIEDDIPEQEIDPVECTKELLGSLTSRQMNVLIHNYGLFGEKSKSIINTGKALRISSESVREIKNRALKKLSHHSRKKLVENLTHFDLKNDIENTRKK